jgi:predicted small metal-binding protein
MKRFACGDIIPGCGTTFTAPDDDGILTQTRRHAVEAHGMAEPGTDSDVLVRPAIRVG